MRALLQKDLCVLWRQMKVFLLLVLVFSLTPSNFQEVFAVVYVAMIPYTIFAQDEASKWNDLASMLPYSTRDIVGSKYLLGGLSIVLSMVFSTLARCVWALAASRPMEPGITLTAGCGAVLIMDLSLPLLFRFGAEKGRMMMVLMVLKGRRLESPWLRQRERRKYEFSLLKTFRLVLYCAGHNVILDVFTSLLMCWTHVLFLMFECFGYSSFEYR